MSRIPFYSEYEIALNLDNFTRTAALAVGINIDFKTRGELMTEIINTNGPVSNALMHFIDAWSEWANMNAKIEAEGKDGRMSPEEKSKYDELVAARLAAKAEIERVIAEHRAR